MNYPDLNKSVTVIIGSNGSGKSMLLRKIAIDYCDMGRTVIAFAPSIYDRFIGIRRSNFRLLSSRSGRAVLSIVMRKALSGISNDNLIMLRRISQVLAHIGFDGEIGIKIHGICDVPPFDEFHNLSPNVKETLDWIHRKWLSNFSHDEIAWIGLNEFSFSEINRSAFSEVAKQEKKLIRYGYIKNVEYFLKKNGEKISLREASSGEITFVTTMIHLISNIRDNSIILIDEPETSLHPNWQCMYIGFLLDLFYLYSPKIVIATHSPLLISGAEVSTEDMSVYLSKNNTRELSLFSYEKHGLEDMLHELFGIVAPKSRYLSDISVSLLNKLSERKINMPEFEKEMKSLLNDTYDPAQEDIISGIREIAKKINSKMNG